MGIVATEVESIHGDQASGRLIFYKCQDHLGQWHIYGPVHVEKGANFDIEGFKITVAAKITESLATSEFEQIIGD